MEMTQAEKKIIELIRKGARVDIWLHEIDEVDDAYEKIDGVGTITGYADYTDEHDSVSVQAVHKDHPEVSLSAFVNVKRR